MKSLLVNTTLKVHRSVFAMRSIIPVAVIMTIILLSLLLPGTVFAGPGSVTTPCGVGC